MKRHELVHSKGYNLRIRNHARLYVLVNHIAMALKACLVFNLKTRMNKRLLVRRQTKSLMIEIVFPPMHTEWYKLLFTSYNNSHLNVPSQQP